MRAVLILALRRAGPAGVAARERWVDLSVELAAVGPLGRVAGRAAAGEGVQQVTAQPLTRTRNDVIYAGHPELSEIPLGTTDVEWMPIVAEPGWVAIRRDRRIHTRPLEVRVFSEVGLRTVWLGGKKDMGAHQQLDLVIRHWRVLEDRREELGAGPWSITLLGGGLSPRVWRSET